MPTLATELRNKLERVVIEARDAAEAGARSALEALAVHHHEPYPHMKPPARELRNHLRARARQLGDRKLPKPDANGKDHDIYHLAEECAYEHWHRMLFARFLAESNLLIEPQHRIPISLAEAAELAKEAGVDVWAYASRCAQDMLPQIFRPDDPLLQVTLATEHRLKLEQLLASLPAAVFTASDALGWVYQFWQSKKKDEINRSEVKIGADEIPAVTQLFTEPYMVEFLLHNTLGAWWAGKQLTAKDAANAKTEDELRGKIALPGVGWGYLRFVRGADGNSEPWRPAAGRFDGWPKTAAALRLIDPCCGSGHFLVAGLHHLVPIRMAEEGLNAPQAVDAVLNDNLHGLEIDERCCQVAAFALAFAAWTYPKTGGYRPLPDLHIACTGIGPQSTEEQWVELAEQSGIPVPIASREAIKNGLLRLHRLFSQAPTLGSLISPSGLGGDLLTSDYRTIQPHLAAVLRAESTDDETRERAIAGAGIVKAATLLAGDYTLVTTNVPYLGRGKQNDKLKAHLEEHYTAGKADLATAFVLRCLEFCAKDGSTGLVTQQNWWFLSTYRRLRSRLLMDRSWQFVVALGEEAWQSFGDRGPVASLCILSNTGPRGDNHIAGIDALSRPAIAEKITEIATGEIRLLSQAAEHENPDHRITLELTGRGPLLERYATSLQGVSPADLPHFGRAFWEVIVAEDWKLWQSAVEQTKPHGGRSLVLWWNQHLKEAVEGGRAFIRGESAWGKMGVACRQMRDLPVTLYGGEVFDTNTAVILPLVREHLPAIWSFASSDAFRPAVRRIDKKVNVTNASFCKVPFDLAYWQKVAAEKFPSGLPEPESDDPTQWLFHGWPEASTAPLQVAVARLLGYRWPAELDDKMLLSKRAQALVKKCGELARFADNDGIVCVPAIRGEESAAERLLRLLSACGTQPEGDLDDWLRNEFFEEQCKLFHDRPFVWHIWDGRKRDGFHALVNYHKLCEGGGKGRRLLESLTYAYLGDWISRQRDGVKRGEGGADDRLAAAVELQNRLKAIIVGEAPFDIFVRWKPLAEQPIGWEPDINDGVRLNIRSFLASDLPIGGRAGAGILRWRPNIKWEKDRGREPGRPKADFPWFWNWDEKTEDFMGTGKVPDGNRHNGCHYSTRVKQAARDAVRRGGRQ